MLKPFEVAQPRGQVELLEHEAVAVWSSRPRRQGRSPDARVFVTLTNCDRRRLPSAPALARQPGYAAHLRRGRPPRPPSLASSWPADSGSNHQRRRDRVDTPLHNLRCHPAVEYAAGERSHFRHPPRFHRYQQRPQSTGHHHCLAVRLVYRGVCGFRHPCRGRGSSARGTRFPWHGRGHGRHDYPEYTGQLRSARHPDPGGCQYRSLSRPGHRRICRQPRLRAVGGFSEFRGVPRSYSSRDRRHAGPVDFGLLHDPFFW